MRKIADGIWKHRNQFIMKDKDGIWIDWEIKSFDLYASLEDAKQAINKYLDGTNTREPRVVGKLGLHINCYVNPFKMTL